ncbi:response regulator [Roseateles chitosanitabidus]|uniref:response regulator n=2 Tax=Roseateles chitosanitabidus TaxID=65048 RepID=UPI001FE12DE5|nr:response regulator transcription factor [Roseateles chitosanitabidus]
MTESPLPQRPITVMAVDDHALMRSGIATVVDAEPDLRMVAEAGNGLDALARFRQHQPDVTLMDLRMRDMDGIEAMAAIRREFPDARIVILTTFPGDFQAARAMKAGASGYLLKGLLRTELVDTIRGVHAGRLMVPPEIESAIAEHANTRTLSLRETQVLRLVATGLANREVAEHLSLTEETVKVHIRTILGKLSAKDRTHAVTIAIKRGIIEL